MPQGHYFSRRKLKYGELFWNDGATATYADVCIKFHDSWNSECQLSEVILF